MYTHVHSDLQRWRDMERISWVVGCAPQALRGWRGAFNGVRARRAPFAVEILCQLM